MICSEKQDVASTWWLTEYTLLRKMGLDFMAIATFFHITSAWIEECVEGIRCMTFDSMNFR